MRRRKPTPKRRRPRAAPARLITAKSGGGLIVETAYALAGVPLTVEEIPWDDVGPPAVASPR
jgi:hypothetical protein